MGINQIKIDSSLRNEAFEKGVKEVIKGLKLDAYDSGRLSKLLSNERAYQEKNKKWNCLGSKMVSEACEILLSGKELTFNHG